MAAKDDYQNAPAPSPHRKMTIFINILLALLILLLTIRLVTLAVLIVSSPDSREERNQELEGLFEKLCNDSFAPGKPSESDLLGLLPSGWKFYDRSLYFFSQEKKTWEEAEKACVSHGAHLTSVTSEKEMRYLHTESQGRLFWIGLTDQEREKTWIWTDGTNYTKQGRFWAVGQPDYKRREDCVQINYQRSALKNWNDVRCTIEFNWICKIICI